jgi:hypothetical protein
MLAKEITQSIIRLYMKITPQSCLLKSHEIWDKLRVSHRYDCLNDAVTKLVLLTSLGLTGKCL